MEEIMEELREDFYFDDPASAVSKTVMDAIVLTKASLLISALSTWLLWKILRKDTNELILTKPNPEQFNLNAANP